jgi:hypothetical protein
VRLRGAGDQLQVLLRQSAAPAEPQALSRPQQPSQQQQQQQQQQQLHPAAALLSRLSDLGLQLRGQEPAAGAPDWLARLFGAAAPPPGVTIRLDATGTPRGGGPSGGGRAHDVAAEAPAPSSAEALLQEPLPSAPEAGRLVASIGGMTCSMCASAVEDAVRQVRLHGRLRDLGYRALPSEALCLDGLGPWGSGAVLCCRALRQPCN